MTIPKEQLEEFKRLYKIEYGKDISNDKARELLINLVLLFKQIYRPIPPEYEETSQEQ
jgi:hypothetical protein